DRRAHPVVQQPVGLVGAEGMGMHEHVLGAADPPEFLPDPGQAHRTPMVNDVMGSVCARTRIRVGRKSSRQANKVRTTPRLPGLSSGFKRNTVYLRRRADPTVRPRLVR